MGWILQCEWSMFLRVLVPLCSFGRIITFRKLPNDFSTAGIRYPVPSVCYMRGPNLTSTRGLPCLLTSLAPHSQTSFRENVRPLL